MTAQFVPPPGETRVLVSSGESGPDSPSVQFNSVAALMLWVPTFRVWHVQIFSANQPVHEGTIHTTHEAGAHVSYDEGVLTIRAESREVDDPIGAVVEAHEWAYGLDQADDATNTAE